MGNYASRFYAKQEGSSSAHNGAGVNGSGSKTVICHYEALDIQQTATPEEIKKAYRQKALILHPDKNPGKETQAASEFAVIQRAYEVLGDVQERAWYDKHREAIIRAGKKGRAFGEDEWMPSVDDLMPYFSAEAFKGFGDDAKGFFAVYREIFEILEEFEGTRDDDNITAFTSFGGKATPFEPSLRRFYDKWLHFASQRSFADFVLDEYDPVYGDNRRVRRAVAKESQKRQEQVRKEFSETVRELAAFVRKRDPRYKALVAKRQEEKERKEGERKERERRQRSEEAGKYVEPEWAKVEINQLHNAASEFLSSAEEESADETEPEEYTEDVESEEEAFDELYCAPCRRSFRSQSQWKNHAQSKKHRTTLRVLGIDPDVILAEDVFGGVEVVEEIEEGEIAADLAAAFAQVGLDEADAAPKALQTSVDVEEAPVEQKKAPRRRRKPKSETTTDATPSANVDSLYTCNVCRGEFGSRNQLFKHIKDSGHAQAKAKPWTNK